SILQDFVIGPELPQLPAQLRQLGHFQTAIVGDEHGLGRLQMFPNFLYGRYFLGPCHNITSSKGLNVDTKTKTSGSAMAGRRSHPRSPADWEREQATSDGLTS